MTDRIEKTIDLKAPVDRVWRALTDATEFGQWFGVKIDGPFVVGAARKGQVTIPGFEHIKWDATVVKMEAPRVFAYTWHPFAIDPDVDYSLETPTLVEFRLQEIETGTRLHVVETGFDALPAHRRTRAFEANGGGWAAQLKNIAAHVER